MLIWWGFHHPLFLLIAAIVYFVFIRRLIRRRRWHGRSGRPDHWAVAATRPAGTESCC